MCRDVGVSGLEHALQGGTNPGAGTGMSEQERARAARSGAMGGNEQMVQIGDEIEIPSPLKRAIDAVADRKGRDLLLLDLRGISNATDYFLLVSGTSDTHVKAVTEHVLDELREDGVKPLHVEGLRTGRWVLLDYVDFVIHVFHPAAREFYQLERLWGDAPAHAFPDEN